MWLRNSGPLGTDEAALMAMTQAEFCVWESLTTFNKLKSSATSVVNSVTTNLCEKRRCAAINLPSSCVQKKNGKFSVQLREWRYFTIRRRKLNYVWSRKAFEHDWELRRMMKWTFLLVFGLETQKLIKFPQWALCEKRIKWENSLCTAKSIWKIFLYRFHAPKDFNLQKNNSFLHLHGYWISILCRTSTARGERGKDINFHLRLSQNSLFPRCFLFREISWEKSRR